MTAILSESLGLEATTSGAATGQTGGYYMGQLHAIAYTPSTSAPYSTGHGWVLSTVEGGVTILSVDGSTGGYYLPRLAACSSSGATSTGTAAVPLAFERLQVTVSSGSTGGITSGSFRFWIS